MVLCHFDIATVMHVNQLHARDTCMSRALMPCLFQAPYILASDNRLADLLSRILAPLELCFSLSHSGTNQPHLTMKSRTRLDIAAVVLFSSFRRQGSLYLPGRPMQLKPLPVRHFNLLPLCVSHHPRESNTEGLSTSIVENYIAAFAAFLDSQQPMSHSHPSILHT